MTRTSVYASALAVFITATALILASIATPNWITYSVTTAKGNTYAKNVGLHKICSTLADPACRVFPGPNQCIEGNSYFCLLWRTVGFMASFTAVLCLACLVSFAVVMSGGKYKRETGWLIIGGMLSLVAVVELVVISLVAYLYDHDYQFAIPGWFLDFSWYLGLVGALLCIVTAGGLVLSAYLLPPEEGYEFLNDPLDA